MANVPDVDKIREEQTKQLTAEKVFGYTTNKFSRKVIVSRKKYSHMKDCNDLLMDEDGNIAKFKKLTDAEITKLTAKKTVKKVEAPKTEAGTDADNK